MSPNNPGADSPLVSLFLELARIASPSGREREVADFLTTRLRGLGFEVSEAEPPEEGRHAAGNICCRLPASVPGTPVFFSAHMDTVASDPEALPDPWLDGGVLRSRSEAVLGADNKAAVAVMVSVMEKIVREEMPTAGVELLLTVCEESGLKGAKAATLEGMAAEAGFCFDATGAVGGVIVRAPSQKTMRASFSGRAAHAGVAPEEGHSAVAAAAKAVAAMKLGRLDDETTANIGIIRGGEAVNVVPAHCQIAGEVRSHDDARLETQVAAMLDAINTAAVTENVDVEIIVVDEFSSFDLSDGNLPADLADRALRDVGIEPQHLATGGGSDVNVFNLKGTPCVNLAMGMEQVHTPDEFITVDSLEKMQDLMLAIIRRARA